LVLDNDPLVEPLHQKLMGIFTERDLVRLAAHRVDLREIDIASVMTRQIQTLVLSAQQTVISALSIFQQHQIRHIPILDIKSNLLGVVTPERVRQALQAIDLLGVRSIREVMTTNAIHTTGDTTMLEIAQLMVEHRVSSIVIVDRLSPPRPIGIVTERDIAQFQALELDLARLSVVEMMSTPIFCLHPEDSLSLAQEIMTSKQIRRVLIIGKDGELQGIITQSSLLRSIHLKYCGWQIVYNFNFLMKTFDSSRLSEH
jgi:CBS domain-containing protein